MLVLVLETFQNKIYQIYNKHMFEIGGRQG